MADPIIVSSEIKESSFLNKYKYVFLFLLAILLLLLVFLLFLKISSDNEISSENNSLSNYSVKNDTPIPEPLSIPIGNEKYNEPIYSNVSEGLAVETDVSAPAVVFDEQDSIPVQTPTSSLPEQDSSVPPVVFE